jgi:hypothetical protein
MCFRWALEKGIKSEEKSDSSYGDYNKLQEVFHEIGLTRARICS